MRMTACLAAAGYLSGDFRVERARDEPEEPEEDRLPPFPDVDLLDDARVERPLVPLAPLLVLPPDDFDVLRDVVRAFRGAAGRVDPPPSPPGASSDSGANA